MKLFSTKISRETLITNILIAVVTSTIGIVLGNWYASQKCVVMVEQGSNGKSLVVDTNDGVAVLENNGDISFNKSPTQTEERISELDNFAQGNLKEFFKRWARGDVERARSQLHDEISNTKAFSFENMTRFYSEILNGNFYLDNLQKINDCTDSIYASLCEYKFTLRYVNKKLNKSITEMRVASILNNKEADSNYFKINSLKCEDRNCENNPLLNW